MNTISCKNITKKFGNFTALDSINIDIPQGEIFGLLGPNGAGKTTLIRIITQITLPDSGEVIFDGRKAVMSDVEKIGYLPEERGLYKKLKVGEQAVYLARLKGMSRQDAVRELKIWFKRFGIQSWWNKKIQELSKGMAQKIQFITTVVSKPKLLILDEPFSGFDPVNAEIIRKEVLRLKDEGTTIALSTHNMESVEELCDNIALINKSKLILSGNVDKIRKDYGKNQVELLYKSGEPLSATLNGTENPFSFASDEELKSCRRAILDVEKTATNSQVLGRIINEADVVSYHELLPRMNDIFIKLVTNE
ncbi:MAG: ATP-binding cassette domain-containing protein [Bacteroidales bacterium]|jgi:ABC-2 type transport system ATP-binding protein|nr:ATP-binding cassette domain-containing protein [Bacteroidales bacterium]